MSFYGMFFGKDKHADELYKMLNLDNYSVGRYRDTFWGKDEDSSKVAIILRTRNGGGNREGYQDCFDDLKTHPNYLKDEDCNWDCTYADIYFSVPKEHKERMIEMIME